MTAVNNFIQNYLSNLYIPRITWTDIIEIFIIAFVLYSFLVWIKNTKAWALLKGIIIVVLFALFAYILNLRTILWIAGKTISVGIIALVIIFQPELRRALEQLEEKNLCLISLILATVMKKMKDIAQRQQMRLSVLHMKWEQ